MTIRPGQCYAHRNHTRYYEIKAIFNGQVDFVVYNSQTDKEDYATHPYDEFDHMVQDGTLIRDV